MSLQSASRNRIQSNIKMATQALMKTLKVEDKEDTTTKDLGFSKNIIKFRRMIGNPISKVTGLMQDFVPFQVQYHLAVQIYHLVMILKSRKLGATETGITSIGLNCFDRYLGHDVMLVAGNKLEIAREIIKRFDELFQDKRQPDGFDYAFKDEYGNRWKYDELIRRSTLNSQTPIVEFRNDSRVFAFAASKSGRSQSYRGPDDLISIYFVESAHTGMEEDQPIMDALLPNLAQRDDADFIMETTGNGKRGVFFNYWMTMMNLLQKEFNKPGSYATSEHQLLCNELWKKKEPPKFLDWYPLMWDYTVGLKYKILSEKFIAKQKRDPNIDFNQEYCCKFTTSKTAAFEALAPENYLPPGEHATNLDSMLPEDLK